MNLIIHDLDGREWEKVRGDYAGWNVVTDNGAMSPCRGCFSCWNRTPGICAVKDGYENMGSLIHEADEVAVISRYTYGGFSASVKNVFDRCLGYVLPQFEVVGNETHHMKRYDEDKPFSFIFYGPELTDDEKACAERYVRAVCRNFRGHVKSVEFRTGGKVYSEAPRAEGSKEDPSDGSDRAVLLNASMRNKTGNSARFAHILAGRLPGRSRTADLRDHMDDMGTFAKKLSGEEKIVLCTPLYVDGLPSQLIRLMELMEASPGRPKKIYVLANMGLYESSQLENLFSAVRQWCGKCGYEYCGGLGISAGELLGALSKAMPFGWGPGKKASIGMMVLANAILKGLSMDDIYAEPHMFPRSLYIKIANSGWDRTAKKNGLSHEDLYRIPDPAAASAAAEAVRQQAGQTVTEAEGIRPAGKAHSPGDGRRIIAVNAGPRKGWNTDTLIAEASKGAEAAGASVESFDLFSLERYTGCISCFGCKKEKNKGHCICRDGLTPVLDAIRESDGLIIGSPNYLSGLTASFRALYERLIFQNLTYNLDTPCCNEHPIPVLLIMTSNAPDDMYMKMMRDYRQVFSRFVGPTEIFVCGETLQLKDYSSTDWEWTLFDPAARYERHEKVFPQECAKLFDLAKELFAQQ